MYHSINLGIAMLYFLYVPSEASLRFRDIYICGWLIILLCGTHLNKPGEQLFPVPWQNAHCELLPIALLLIIYVFSALGYQILLAKCRCRHFFPLLEGIYGVFRI